MNHRIVLQRRDVGEDSIGQQVDTWSPVSEVWANVRFQTGAEVMRAGAETSTVKASVRIRVRSDVDVGWRAVYKSSLRTWVFDIKSPPLPDPRDSQFMFLVCEAVK